MVKGLVFWQKSIKDNGLSTQDYKKYYFKHGGGTSYQSNLVENGWPIIFQSLFLFGMLIGYSIRSNAENILGYLRGNIVIYINKFDFKSNS